METTTVGMQGIGQIAIRVRDVQRATGFYRDVLGLNLLFEIPQAAFFDCGGIRLMLAPAEEPRFDHPASIIYYRVPDIHEAHRALAARGAFFEREPHMIARMPDHELWMAFLHDDSDNVLALMCEVR